MNIIKIAVDDTVTACDFPEGLSVSEVNAYLNSLIGDDCDMYQMVHFARLYEELGAVSEISDIPGEAVTAIVDEEGLWYDLPVNTIGSYLYKTDVHGQVIVGTALIVGLRLTSEGADITGISDEQFNLLYPQLCELAEIVKSEKEQ